VGDMHLVQDLETGLIHNAAFDPALLEYDPSYQNEQACSEAFPQHLDDIHTIIERFFAGRTLVEVGCGKGYFLEYLQARGRQITGVDPAYEGSNPAIVKARFDASLGLSAEGVILRHVLEHIADPHAFLQAIAEANGGKGLIYIEVPCFDWICDHRAWFDVFYEHVNYFRMADFHRLFGRVLECGRLFGGQYLFVVAELESLRPPRLEGEKAFEFPPAFLGSVERMATLLKGKRNAIWGGASKGVIFSLYMRRAGVALDLAIDINPQKQDKFMAATGLPILSPERALPGLAPDSNVIIMNSNYFDEIVARSHNQHHYLKVDDDGL
jgi:SAM-dependent methyltransferase